MKIKKNNTLRHRIRKAWVNPNLKFWVAPFLLLLALLWSFYSSHEANLWHRFLLIINNILRFGLPLCLMSVGASLVIATGGVDISSSGVATLTGIILALMIKLGLPLYAAIIFCFPIGITSGILLGISVTKLHSPPMILSWAWGLALMTFAYQFCAGRMIPFSDANVNSIRTGIVSASPSMYYWAFSIVCIFIWYIIYTGISRRACAVGANRESAIYAGIRADRTVIWSYVVSGLCSGFAGIVWFFFEDGSASTSTFFGNELIPIAVALIGGTVISGGYLNLLSVVAASFFWANLDLIITNYPTEDKPAGWQDKILILAFACVIILISTILGKKLKGETITIHTVQKVKN